MGRRPILPPSATAGGCAPEHDAGRNRRNFRLRSVTVDVRDSRHSGVPLLARPLRAYLITVIGWESVVSTLDPAYVTVTVMLTAPSWFLRSFQLKTN